MKKLKFDLRDYFGDYGIGAQSISEFHDELSGESLIAIEDDDDRKRAELKLELYEVQLEIELLTNDLVALAEERDNARATYGIFSREYKAAKKEFDSVDKQCDSLRKKSKELQNKISSLAK